MMKSTRPHASLIVLLLLLLCAAGAWAKGPADVSNTIHNLSTTAPYIYYRSANETQICIFCHTPHGGVLDGPLWNRSLTTGTWTHYNSASLSSAITDVNRPLSDESMLCMACHDGSISVFHVINQSSIGQPTSAFYVGSDDVKIVGLFDGNVGARIGATPSNTGATGDLSDDHPISFSYTAVLAGGEYGTGGAKENQLHSVVDAETADVRFFGSDKRVECSSCHDPHVDYENNPEYTPFLIRPNSGSGLCLACHNK